MYDTKFLFCLLPFYFCLSALVQVVGKPAEILDLQTTILEVFAQYKKLLILGKPGIGKTTTLLTLANQRLKSAAADTLELSTNGSRLSAAFELLGCAAT